MGAVKLMKTRLTVINITDMFRRRRDRRADVEPARDDERTNVRMIMIVQAIMAGNERERRNMGSNTDRSMVFVSVCALTCEWKKDVHEKIDPYPVEMQFLVFRRAFQWTVDHVDVERGRRFQFDCRRTIVLQCGVTMHRCRCVRFVGHRWSAEIGSSV